MVQVNWKRITELDERFKPFVPVDMTDLEFYKKLVVFKKNLMTKYLYLSDENRTVASVEAMISDYVMRGGAKHMLFEIGDFDGILGFVNIIPEFQCSMILKLWGKKAWGNGFVKSTRKLMDTVMDEFKLKRISTSTADEKIVRMAKMAGFVEEGKQKYGFMWKGKAMDLYFLGYLMEG